LPFVDVEDHLINELPGAREIPLFFEGEHAFYQTLGSFIDPVEADVYSVFPLDALAAEGIVDDVIGFPDEDPSFPDGDPNVIIGELHEQLEPLTMTVIVQSLGAAMLNPDVRILDEFGNEIPSRIVVNGNGELIVQAEGIVQVIQYFVEVRESGSAVGNYELEVEFDLPSVELAEYLSGELTEADPQQLETLYVATPQLFHFLLDVEETESGSGKVAVEIVNEQGEVVYSISASPGEIRSAANPLLQPGTYHVRVTLIEPGKLGEVFSYALQGQSVSELLGVLPSDPGSQPDFQCDGVTEEFCYPGGQTSDRPFFWDKFIRDYLNRKEDDKEPSPANEDISWWDWYQQLQRKGSKAKPTARTDTYRVLDGKLHVAKKLGLLKNDASEYSNHMIVTVSKAPRHGTINVKADGSFTYVPETDFFGTDSFFYQAFDFVNASDPVEVTIHRSAPGDSNNDNQIGFADFLVLTMNFLKSDATWEDGDFSGDGKVDFQDFLLLSQSYGLPASAAARKPDEN
jgi:hypothetical protein